MSGKRDLIVVDVETTGLEIGLHVPLEVAAVNMKTGQELYFVPQLPLHALNHADGNAMRINRYFERGVYEKALGQQATIDSYYKLWEMLTGNTLGGSNPRFDAEMLCAAYGNTGNPTPWQVTARRDEPWHYRLADLAAYAAGTLALLPSALPGLSDVCQRLGVANEEEHSALGDARATAECFRRLTTLKAGE